MAKEYKSHSVNGYRMFPNKYNIAITFGFKRVYCTSQTQPDVWSELKRNSRVTGCLVNECRIFACKETVKITITIGDEENPN